MAIEVVFEKRINNAVHHDVDTDQRREYVLLTFLAGLFVLGLLFYGWQQYRWRQSGYEIESAIKRRDELVEYRKQLRVERENLASLERIDSLARNRLGMTAAAPGQTVTFTADAPLKVPAAANDTPLTASKEER